MPNKRLGEEYPSKSGIIITPKRNPSGSQSYRVDIPSTITGGGREQRQFPTLTAARDHATSRHDEITRFGHAAFALSSAQRNDAARALAFLSPLGLTLEQAAQIALQHTPKNREQVTVTQLRKLFLAAPGRRKNQLTLRRQHTVRGHSWRLKRLEKRFGNVDVRAVTAEQLKAWLRDQGELSPVSRNNFRRALHAMFSFAVSEGYCTANPVAALPLYHVPQKTPAILKVDECAALLSAAASTNRTLGLLGYVVLGLFGGLRRTEIERLEWSAFHEARRMVTVDGAIAKTGSIRNVALAPNAMEWLSLIGDRIAGKVCPRNLTHKLRRLRFLAGIEKWSGNELRHSFASYHYDCHQNAPLTAAMLGHTSGTQLLFEHYRSLVLLGEGERFFALRPKATGHGITQVQQPLASGSV